MITRQVHLSKSVNQSFFIAVADHLAAHPFFTGELSSKDLGTFLPSPPTLIHYLHLDPFATSPSPTASSSALAKIPVTFYDLDQTLIKPRTGNRFPTTRSDWQWWHSSVLAKMKSEWEDGRHLIVISNQGDSRESIRREWRAKLPLIVAKVSQSISIRLHANSGIDAAGYADQDTGRSGQGYLS
jgi:bifunctional polynucleotide phosphatase/kinase